VVEGVVDDVLDRGFVLLVRLDHLGPVAAAEDVILPLVAFVECASVAAVQVPHPVGEVRQRGLDEEVVVVPHQAAHVRAPAVAPFDPAHRMWKKTIRSPSSTTIGAWLLPRIPTW